MDAAPRSAPPTGRFAEASLLAVVAGLLSWAVLDGHGSRPDALSTVGVAALAAAALGLGVALRGGLPLTRLDRAGGVAVAAATALVAWTGLSIIWSIAGDASWEWLDRGLVNLAFLALGLLAGAAADGLRRVAAATALVAAAAVGWSLLGVAIPSLFEDGDRIARLREPVGYWNGLALLADAGLVLGLWAATGERRAPRVAGALLVYGSTISLLLTQSRAGAVAAVVVAGAWVALSRPAAAAALRAALSAVPGLAVAGWAFTRPALVEDGALRADRVADGRVFAALAVAGAIVVAGLAIRVDTGGLVARHAVRVRRALAAGAAALLIGGAAGLVAAVGEPFGWAASQLSGGECVNAPGRLTDLCANNRLDWWRDALEVAADRPLGGSGAGTFAIARRRYREDATPVSEPHSVPLQVLSDTGVVGLALAAFAALAAAFAVVASTRRAGARERPAAQALALVLAAFGIHALVDYDLDFLALTAPTGVALGALLSAGRPAATVRARTAGLVALTAVTLAAALSVLVPALAEAEVDRSLADLDARRLERAVERADRARLLDPLSRAPLEARALAADAAGDRRAAVAWYEEAVDLQPENPDAWYELGLYHVVATGDQCAAYEALNRSYTLDPKSSRWAPGGPLDDARDAVNRGACER